jgi:uncharacterized protein YndB with AHSA1/START domain
VSNAEKAGRERDRVSASHDLEIDVYYDAPREEIFENWTDATKLRTWFAPYGFDVTCPWRIDTAAAVDAI